MSNLKQERLNKLWGEERIFRALAIDQRGALKSMLGEDATDEQLITFKGLVSKTFSRTVHITARQLITFKGLVSKTLTPLASAILLDPEYGWHAAQLKDGGCGLIMAYEKTGYDKTKVGRFPDLIDGVSVKNLKEKGANAVKLLLYIDVDEGAAINEAKTAFVERIGSECVAEEMPFFLEILTYDAAVSDKKAFAKLKPRKVNEAMRLFSETRFNVDVLKVEVPVDMNFVEGFGEERVYSQEEAKNYFKAQSESTHLPFIFLSAGVSPKLFQETLVFAQTAGSAFNGVLCGRATWAGATDAFKRSGAAEAEKWLQQEGVKNIGELNDVLVKTANAVR